MFKQEIQANAVPSPSMGADPELFLTDSEGNVISAEEIRQDIMPPKEKFPAGRESAEYSAQKALSKNVKIDNVLLEYNTRPTYCLQGNNASH